MNQDQIILHLLSFLAGCGLGAFFYGGLWWTLKRLPGMSQPQLMVLVSFLIRAAVTVAGIWYATEGQWSRVAAALAGFILLRIILTKKLDAAPTPEFAKKETRDES